MQSLAWLFCSWRALLCFCFVLFVQSYKTACSLSVIRLRLNKNATICAENQKSISVAEIIWSKCGVFWFCLGFLVFWSSFLYLLVPDTILWDHTCWPIAEWGLASLAAQLPWTGHLRASSFSLQSDLSWLMSFSGETGRGTPIPSSLLPAAGELPGWRTCLFCFCVRRSGYRVRWGTFVLCSNSEWESCLHTKKATSSFIDFCRLKRGSLASTRARQEKRLGLGLS